MTSLYFSPGCWVLILEWGKKPIEQRYADKYANVSNCFAPLCRLLKQLELFFSLFDLQTEQIIIDFSLLRVI